MPGSRPPVEVPLGIVGATLVALSFVFAATGWHAYLPPGPLVWMGIPSPTSGMTRSFVALARGDVLGSFDWHPLGPVLFVLCLAAVVAGARALVRGQGSERLARALGSRRLWILIGLVVTAAWIRQIAVLDV